jgi:signal transduction histidine kinase
MSEVRALVDTDRAVEARLTHGPADHLVQFYETDEFLAEATSRFLAEGLIGGEAVLIVATPDHAARTLKKLEAKGFDVGRAREASQITALDARECIGRYLVEGEARWDLFEREMGGAIARCIGGSRASRVRAYGEMVDLLWREGQPQTALRVEEFWGRLRSRYPFSLLCGYVMGNFFKESDSSSFRQVCDLHQQVLPAEACPQDGEVHARDVALLRQRALALETELQHRKELEEALRCAQEQAEAASRAKDEFLAMLGHELRNPLAPIVTALELMKLRGDGQGNREQEVIERQTRHLIRLVDDLLDVSKVARGILELRRQRVDLREVLFKAMEIASPLLEIRRHHLEVHAPPRGALALDGDEARLAQVIANLLTNAAKYTPPGGHVLLEARREGSEAVVEVRDDGNGISPELLPRIFDLFVQGRQSMDRGEGGLGIGLALVRSLTQLHGGRVSARSAGRGQGSTFTVRLPSAGVQARGPEPSPSPLRPAVSPRRVLVVDDNEDALAMLTELLRSAGHQVCAASDGPSALELARRFRPEVAILDLGLPAMDGYELASRLRRQTGGDCPRLVALSGYGQESDRSRSTAAGFARHLVKPLETSELLAAIESP